MCIFNTFYFTYISLFMASVKLHLKKSQVLKDGSHPIIIQVLKDSKKSIATIGLSCEYSEWNENLNLPKNRRLSIICQKKLLEVEELVFLGEEKGWTAKKILNVFLGKDTEKLMFKHFFLSEFSDKNTNYSTFRGKQNKINAFFDFYKEIKDKDDLSFDEMDYKLLREYKESLVKKNYKTVHIYISALKQVYEYAVEYDFYTPKTNPFKKGLIKRENQKETKQLNLSLEQAQGLFQIVPNSKVRELFLDFWKCCFLLRGINLIDLAMIKTSEINNNYYTFTREKLKSKTTRIQRVKVFPEFREISEKYYKKENEFLFPIFENGDDKDKDEKAYLKYKKVLSSCNYHFTEIGKQLDADFNMTSMSARYTFINLAKSLEIPFLYLQELIGHRTMTTTDVYMDVFKQEDVDKYHRKVIDLVLNKKE